MTRDPRYDQEVPQQSAEWHKSWCVCNHHEDVHKNYARECQVCLCARFRQRTPNPTHPDSTSKT